MKRKQDYPLFIPTWENGQWVQDTEFNSLEEFISFLESLFKEPGQYNFDESTILWKEQALNYNKNGFYCKAPFRSKDFINYWDDQKRKSRIGVIWKNNGNTWYLTRNYYFWLNFLPIFDKEKGIYDFPNIWDVQYHMALYEILAELNNKHVAILKKRQIASSYFHVGLLINYYWFEEGAKLKMGASLKTFINEKGSWKMAQEYSDFLNEHTAWNRAHNPGKVMDWEQKIQITINGRDIYKGLKSTLTGHSFDKDATGGVGGPCRIFFHEEGGIAPKADQTYEFMRPALSSGMLTTGLFIIAGSVGNLDQCKPLKKYILNPEKNDFYAVESNLIDEKGTIGRHGLFIPEQWSMPPYIDEYGNSLVEEALQAIMQQRVKWKKDLEPFEYQLRISQKPTNIKEAFDWRSESIFPLNLITQQQRRVDDGLYPYERIELKRNLEKNIVVKKSDKQPITDFPVKKNMVNKEGCLLVWERPKEKPEWGMYYASVDPVSEGATTTSDSLCSIYVYKNSIRVRKKREDGSFEYSVEPGKIVAAWCGRYDDLNKTHEQLELIIEWYNAWTLVENNIASFILYMIAKRKNKYLVPKDQILFLKNIGSNKTVYADYGWKNTGRLFKDHMLSYTLEFLNDEIDQELDEDGVIINRTYGVERIPDPMLLKEMSEYREGLNVDRLVSFAALVSFIRIQESNRGIKEVEEKTDSTLDKSKNLFNLKRNPFVNLGKSKYKKTNTHKRGFRNLK
jgi:hypothetical protein